MNKGIEHMNDLSTNHSPRSTHYFMKVDGRKWKVD